MSAHSFPSLTSDSSSIPSRSSDPHETHSNDHTQPVVSSGSTYPHLLSVKDPEATSEVIQLRNRVSKLEQDKFVLGDYAAELQSRIRRLERDRMENHDAISHDRGSDPREKAQNKLSNIFQPSRSRPSTPAGHSRGTGSLSVSHHRASSSLSAATSTTARRALSHVSPLPKTPSPTPDQLAFPSTPKLRLIPKRGTRPEATLDPSSYSASLHDSSQHTSTPTRRRLQAMCGRLSLDAIAQSPAVNGEILSNHDINDHEPRSARDAHVTRTFNSMPSRRESGRHDPGSDAKRTAFTSKLDSVILTSKFFPLSSSRSKAPLESVSTSHRTQNCQTAVVPFTHPLPSSSSRTDNVFLDSPPRKHVKVKIARKGNKSLSHSLGLEENRHHDIQPRSDDRKPRSRGRVSFSERLFSSPLDRGGETDTEPEHPEHPGGLWGSWGRKKRTSTSQSFRTEKHSGTPPSIPPSAFSARFTKSRGEGGGEPEEKRYDKRRSLAAGCLRFVSGSYERDKPLEGESRVLRRSRSESRKSRSHSRSYSPSRDRTRHDHESGAPKNPVGRDKDEKPRITPSRVGSPKPKGRVSDLQHIGEELERTSSLRSAGKWGQRGRAFTHEVTRRRTIHPMFSFERPGSAAASTSSSRRADDEELLDGCRAGGARVHASAGKPSRRTRHEVPADGGVSSSHGHAPRIQDDSGTSGHTALSLARSESVSTQKGKGPMMHTRLGVQTHGTFAFEPAAAVVVPPRSAPPNGRFALGAELSSGTRAHAKNRHMVSKSVPAEGRDETSVGDPHDQAYLDFCDDLKVVLGDGEEWASFTKYIRRFDIEVLTADVLLRRVKRLIDGSKSVDQSMKQRLYERFVRIVQDNVEDHVILGS